MSEWRILKCLVKGTSHSDGTPCQDYVDVEERGNMIVAVLADGLGSKPYSEVAAQNAAETVKKMLFTDFGSFNNNSRFKYYLIDQCRKQIKESASAYGRQVKDMDCTLLFAAICNNEVVVGQLGDGAICMLGKDSGGLFCKPHKGNVVNSTMTVFSHDAASSLQINRYGSSSILEAIILTSDGLERDLYYPNSTVVKKIAAVYAQVVGNETAKKASAQIKGRIRKLQSVGADDDISIAVISKNNTVISLPDDPTWLCTCGKRNPIDITHCEHCAADFIDVYSDMDFSHEDKVVFFRNYNGSVEEAENIERKKNALQAPDGQFPIVGQQDMNKEESNMSNHSFLKKMFVTSFYILTCAVCLLLGGYITSKRMPDTAQIDYDELASFVHELNQQDHQEELTKAANRDEIAQMLDDLKGFIQQSLKKSGKKATAALAAPVNMSVYRNMVAILLETYGDQGHMEFAPYGCKRYADESYYIGEMSNGSENGNGMIFNADGSLLIGEFANGEKQGEFCYIDENGRCKNISFANSVQNGGE